LRVKAKNLVQTAIGLRLSLLLIFYLGAIPFFVFFSDFDSTINLLITCYLIPQTIIGILSYEGIFFASEFFLLGSILRFLNQLIFSIFILFIVQSSEDILYAGYGSLLGSLISIFIGWYYLKKEGFSIIPNLNFQKQYNLFKTSINYALSSFFSMIYAHGGIIIAKFLLSPHELGILSAAKRFIEIILDFIRLIQKPYVPRITKLIEQKGDYLNYYRSLIRLAFLVTVPSMFLFYFNIENIFLLLFDSSFIKSSLLVKYMLPNLLFGLTANIFSGVLIIFKKSDKYLLTVIFSSIISLLVYLIGGFFFGIIAFCLGYIAGELCVSLISYFYSRKKLENLFILSNFAKFAMDLMIVILASLVFKYISEISTHTLIKVTIPIIVYFPLLILLIKEDFKIFEEKI
jgi:O-antigen/teichoic acid export membrane protein